MRRPRRRRCALDRRGGDNRAGPRSRPPSAWAASWTLVASGKLGGYESAARILPSAATQRARLAALPQASVLRERLAQALTQSPLPAAKLGPFVEDVEHARAEPPLERTGLAGGALAAALEGLLFRDTTGRWNAIVALRAAPGIPIDASAVRSALATSGTGALLVDLKAEADRLYAGYLGRAATMSAVGLAVIVALFLRGCASRARGARHGRSSQACSSSRRGTRSPARASPSCTL